MSHFVLSSLSRCLDTLILLAVVQSFSAHKLQFRLVVTPDKLVEEPDSVDVIVKPESFVHGVEVEALFAIHRSESEDVSGEIPVIPAIKVFSRLARKR